MWTSIADLVGVSMFRAQLVGVAWFLRQLVAVLDRTMSGTSAHHSQADMAHLAVRTLRHVSCHCS
jgi:hypothetical protein